MKRILLLFLFHFCVSLYIHAQVSLGVSGGFNLSAMEFQSVSGQKSGGICSGNQLKNLHVDLLLDIPLYEGLYLQPVFGYITKGTLFESVNYEQNSTLSGEAGSRVNVRYIELPLNLLYKFRLPGCKLTVGGGPYAAYGLKGSYSSDIIANGKIVAHNRRSLAFDNTDHIISPGMYLNRWDAGINTMIGLELNNMMMFGVNYSMGMVDIDNAASYKVKNSYVGISVGILFNREDY